MPLCVSVCVYIYIYTYNHIFIIRSAIDRYSGCLSLLASADNAALNVGMQVSV